MFTRILVPLDGSELAERALPCAEQLAQTMGATLHLVRVTEPLPTTAYAYGPINVYDDIIAPEIKAATEYLEQLRDRLAGKAIAVHLAFPTGYASSTLLDYERDAAIDLVVMCSHGRTGLSRFALGSVADRLLRHGAAPLLLVRAFGEPANLQQAVIPLDGSQLAEQALPLLDHLAPRVIQEVTLLRAIGAASDGPQADSYLAETAQRMRREHLACWCRVVQGDAAEAIVDAAGSEKLVVMATHGRGGIRRWAVGSVADRVAHSGTAALLLVRARA